MTLLNFFGDEKLKNPLIQKESDIEKYITITNKLSQKRKELEEKLKACNKENIAEHEELALSLVKAKENLHLFGVSETDYQIWCIKNEKENNPASQANRP